MHSSLTSKLTALLLAPLVLMAAATAVQIPYQTRIKVFLKDAVSPSQVQVGDRVHLIVVENVVVSGYVVFAKGADGLATVDNVSNGSVHVTFNWVHNVDGSKVGVVGEQTTSSGSGTTSGGGSVDITDAMNRAQTVAANVGSSQTSQAVNNTVARAEGTFGALLGGGNSHPSAPATAAPQLPINLLVKNPSGVTVMATEHSEDDDSGVK